MDTVYVLPASVIMAHAAPNTHCGGGRGDTLLAVRRRGPSALHGESPRVDVGPVILVLVRGKGKPAPGASEKSASEESGGRVSRPWRVVQVGIMQEDHLMKETADGVMPLPAGKRSENEVRSARWPQLVPGEGHRGAPA